MLHTVRNKLQRTLRDLRRHPLTKEQVGKGLWRYVWFNIVQGIYPKRRVYRWVPGLKFYARKGNAGIVANIYFKLRDFEESTFLVDHLNPGELFIDVGANVGHFTMLAAGVCKAKVIAFEPIPSTFTELEENLQLNNLESLALALNFGVGNLNTKLNFTSQKDVLNRVAIEGDEQVISVEVKRLDDLLQNEMPVFIKIDVEGYEYNVILGALNTFKKPSLKYLLIEFNYSSDNFGSRNDEIFQMLLEMDFVPVQYTLDKKIVLLHDYNRNKANTLFIKKQLVAKL